jgi:hypothetical protein
MGILLLVHSVRSCRPEVAVLLQRLSMLRIITCHQLRPKTERTYEYTRFGFLVPRRYRCDFYISDLGCLRREDIGTVVDTS